MKAFKNAKWISYVSDGESMGAFSDEAYILRKEFTGKGKIHKAVMCCCGLGYGVYTINGKKVTEDVLVTPFTQYDKTVIYNTYDVTKLLKKGANAVGVMLGNGFYNDNNTVWNFDKASWRSCPKLLCDIAVTYDNGKTEHIVSGPDWKADPSPITFNRMRSGQIYDARLYQKGWDEPGFDDSDWQTAKICHPPGGILKTTSAPPIRIIRTIKPVKISDNIYDAGENISGWARIKVKGKEGSEVLMCYGELLREGERLGDRTNIFIQSELKHADKYILCGKGEEEYESSFAYHGFRYIKLTTNAELLEITVCVVHTDLKIIGEFTASDEMLNKIHEAARRSTLTNYMDIPTDCPHREQNGWTGDAAISCEQALMNYDMKEAYRKWMMDFKDAQRPTGALPGIIPTGGWGQNWGNGPAWDSAMFIIPQQVYKNTGDSSLIELMWDNMSLYMEYMKNMAVGYIADYGLGDWCPPKNICLCPTAVTDTGYFYDDALMMSGFAKLLGKKDEYSALAKEIKKAYREKFLADKDLLKSQTFIACGLYRGMYNKKEIPEMAKRLADLVISKDYHFDCGILGMKYIFTALSENGYADIAYKAVINPTAPSYAKWMNDGETTLCEDWENENYDVDGSSHNHHMYSEVDNWFYKYIAGIRIDVGEITIKPCFIKEIKHVKASHRNIKVEYNETQLKVSIPKRAKIIVGGKEYIKNKGDHVFNI